MTKAQRRRKTKKHRAQHARRRLKRLVEANPHCHWCGVRVTVGANADGSLPPTHATSDHWWPLTMLKGLPPVERKHVVLACHACNNARGDIPPDEWAKRAGPGPIPG